MFIIKTYRFIEYTIFMKLRWKLQGISRIPIKVFKWRQQHMSIDLSMIPNIWLRMCLICCTLYSYLQDYAPQAKIVLKIYLRNKDVYIINVFYYLETLCASEA